MAENTFVLKLSEGADIMESLEKLAQDNSIDYGLFVSASGRMKEFELISTEAKGGLSRTKFDSVFEVNAISGKIQRDKSGKASSNIRVSVTSTGFTPKAGQLTKGKSAGMLEIGVRKVNLKKIIEA